MTERTLRSNKQINDGRFNRSINENSSKKLVNYNPIYLGSDACDMFWEIIHEKNFINVYGIKQIDKQGELFVYEGVLFDKFPDDYDSLYIGYRNRFDCERAEEIEILELTDTKIVFKCSVKFPEDKDNIILQWN